MSGQKLTDLITIVPVHLGILSFKCTFLRPVVPPFQLMQPSTFSRFGKVVGRPAPYAPSGCYSPAVKHLESGPGLRVRIESPRGRGCRWATAPRRTWGWGRGGAQGDGEQWAQRVVSQEISPRLTPAQRSSALGSLFLPPPSAPNQAFPLLCTPYFSLTSHPAAVHTQPPSSRFLASHLPTTLFFLRPPDPRPPAVNPCPKHTPSSHQPPWFVTVSVARPFTPVPFSGLCCRTGTYYQIELLCWDFFCEGLYMLYRNRMKLTVSSVIILPFYFRVRMDCPSLHMNLTQKR